MALRTAKQDKVSPPSMGDKMITRKLPSNQEDTSDVTEIDLQDYKDVDSIAFYQ
ncbi:hypothetical protein E2562_036552, partial [Oryza meyeriana var. granulata]